MNDFEASLRKVILAPYITKATALIGVRRKSGSNMFRHQISTLGILLDYKMTDPVLLKASVIHDLFEDGAHLPGVMEEEIKGLDAQSPEVFKPVFLFWFVNLHLNSNEITIFNVMSILAVNIR